MTFNRETAKQVCQVEECTEHVVLYVMVSQQREVL